jgi:hypothetical protein
MLSSLYSLGDPLLSIVGLSVAVIHACLQTVTKLQQYPHCSGCQASCIRGYVIRICCLAMGISIQPSTQHVTLSFNPVDLPPINPD